MSFGTSSGSLESVVTTLEGLEIPGYETVIGITAIDASRNFKKMVPIVSTSEPNKFLALFPRDDVDFEVMVNNKCPNKGFHLDLQVQDERRGFVCRPKFFGSLQTLSSRGKKFHFFRRSHPDSEAYIGDFARSRSLLFAEAEKILTRLTFTDVSLQEPRFQIFVKGLTGTTTTLIVTENYTVCKIIADLTSRVSRDLFDYESCEYYFVYNQRVLSPTKTLKYYGITKDANLEINFRLRGGDKDGITGRGSNTPGDRSTNETGIVVLGERSAQVFGKSELLWSDNVVKVQDFVIELRHKPKYIFDL